jgi:hypothetical protein
MARTLPKRHAGSPIFTNASINREHAIRCFAAGLTVADIAAEWPEVFKVTVEHGVPKLGQIYDYELADGSGRYETDRTITRASVDAAIAARKSKH